MTGDERRAYGRGYYAGQHARWPDCVPNPPIRVVADLVRHVKAARNALDTVQAWFPRDDDMTADIATDLHAAIDALDAALEPVDQYLQLELVR